MCVNSSSVDIWFISMSIMVYFYQLKNILYFRIYLCVVSKWVLFFRNEPFCMWSLLLFQLLQVRFMDGRRKGKSDSKKWEFELSVFGKEFFEHQVPLLRMNIQQHYLGKIG
eukprot:TRINITY_DN4950_c0_g1_i3.p2 TRINITY_DN4950_c0_g1~~TRINITY_DN4950_c0_g1_i3.p2  ORF type:complete len:111 (-),score=4.19 TRINITY_DN4950_c0_g1_i3:71-403(-)